MANTSGRDWKVSVGDELVWDTSVQAGTALEREPVVPVSQKEYQRWLKNVDPHYFAVQESRRRDGQEVLLEVWNYHVYSRSLVTALHRIHVKENPDGV